MEATTQKKSGGRRVRGQTFRVFFRLPPQFSFFLLSRFKATAHPKCAFGLHTITQCPTKPDDLAIVAFGKNMRQVALLEEPEKGQAGHSFEVCLTSTKDGRTREPADAAG